MGPDTPEIAGIDTHLGLKSVGGKRERYESLLRKFAGRQAGAVEAIRAALSVGDTSTAERAAHSLKGAASTLGVIALAEQAAQAEIAIKTGERVDETLDSLSQSLATVVEGIHAALPE
jgi:HPt (histidine-containing phosphotransfer) domain-containing protein